MLRSSILNFERLDILRDSIGPPSEKILSLEFYKAFVFNFERLDMLRDSIGLPSEKLLSLEFATIFDFKYRASQYVTGLNQTSE